MTNEIILADDTFSARLRRAVSGAACTSHYGRQAGNNSGYYHGDIDRRKIRKKVRQIEQGSGGTPLF